MKWHRYEWLREFTVEYNRADTVEKKVRVLSDFAQQITSFIEDENLELD